MIKAFCDWCGAEVRTRALKANEPHAPAINQDVVLPGLEIQGKVKVEVKVTAGDGQHICSRCSARAVAMVSNHLEGPIWPPEVVGETESDSGSEEDTDGD